ncbi:MAG: DsrE family protein [Betaproteobacteria bacterium]
MKRKAWLGAAALTLAAALSLGASAQAAAPAKSRVVFQVSDGDPGKWNLTLNNAHNVQQDLGADKVDIEIVAYGPGIGMVKADAVIANRLAEAVHDGIQVVACENTMKALKLTKDDMNVSVGYVRAGVVELMKRQGEGWAYIKP